MRKMTKRTTVVNVIAHIILKNGWEYYVTDNVIDKDNHIVECVVVGHEVELGDVCLKELASHKLSYTSNLDELMPAPEWKWT